MVFFIALMMLAVGCGTGSTEKTSLTETKKGLKILSFSFKDGEPIPMQSTCDSLNISPQISWTGVPEDAASLAITCEDPDAPGKTFTHWIVYNISIQTPRLPENQPLEEKLPNMAKQGINDFGKIGWNGPCPPAGKLHHYVFTIYALDKNLEFTDKPNRADFDQAIFGHVIERASFTGTYQKK